jgi:endonuclease YncB( thermonuclease family)
MFKESTRYALLLIILLGTQVINVHAWEIDQISSVTRIVDGDSFHIIDDEVRLADVNVPE